MGVSLHLTNHMRAYCGLVETDRVDHTDNPARAMRIAEIMDDFSNLLNYLAAIRASPSAEEYEEEGYLVLRRCAAESQALLLQPFQAQGVGRRDEEQNKLHLRR